MTAVSFVYMIEKGADGMNTGNMSPKIRIAMRGVAGAMVPLTMEMPAGVFVYWLVSNGFSIAQTHAMKVRLYLICGVCARWAKGVRGGCSLDVWHALVSRVFLRACHIFHG